jgi:hypothetical protein
MIHVLRVRVIHTYPPRTIKYIHFHFLCSQISNSSPPLLSLSYIREYCVYVCMCVRVTWVVRVARVVRVAIYFVSRSHTIITRTFYRLILHRNHTHP